MLPPGAKLDKMLLKSARNSKVGFNFKAPFILIDSLIQALDKATHKNRTSNLMRITLRKFKLKINQDRLIDNDIMKKECLFGTITN